MLSFLHKIVRLSLKGASVVIPFLITGILFFYPLNYLSNIIILSSYKFFGLFLNQQELAQATEHHTLLILILRYLPPLFSPPLEFAAGVPYMSLLLTFFFFVFCGFLTSFVFVQTGVKLFENLLIRIPLLSPLYIYIRESTVGFIGKFNKPVLITLHLHKDKDLEVQKLGFITQEEIYHIEEGKQKVVVYLPHSYTFSGELIFCSKEQVRRLSISTLEAWKIILSGGLIDINHPLVTNK